MVRVLSAASLRSQVDHLSKFGRDRYVESLVYSTEAAAPHLFVADIQSGQLDRCVAWLVAARVLQVQTGMAELAREAGVAEAELPAIPCHPMLLVAHAERDLHARSIDDNAVTTVSALVLLCAIECVVSEGAVDRTACSACASDPCTGTD